MPRSRLLSALTACQEITLRMVAASMGIEVNSTFELGSAHAGDH